MENNSDKLLRDKLKGIEFPNDPQAWEQMEAMLDKKPKRRGIFFWWFSGVAALLVLGYGTFQFAHSGKGSEENANGKEQTAKENKSAVSSQQLANGEEQKANEEKEKAKSKEQRAKEDKSAVGSQQLANDGTQRAKGNKQTANENQNAVGNGQLANWGRENKKSKSPKAIGQKTNGNSNDGISKKNKKHSSSSDGGQENKSQSDVTVAQNVTHKEKNVAGKSKKGAKANAEKIASNENLNTSENVILPATKEAFEALYVEVKKADELAADEKDNKIIVAINGDEAGVVFKKKKIFHYSLGVLTSVSATSAGAKYLDGPSTASRSAWFYNQPTYMAGFTNDFLFFRRFAITNSILFSQTSFKLFSPISNTYITAPLAYSSKITELDIPIGIKVYPVSKPNFRFYINVGIINHIKLKETFSYAVDTVLPSASMSADNAFYPAQTNFNANVPALSTGGNVKSIAEVNTGDFSINQGKRYYLSLYTGVGFEGIIKNHWVIFGEPTFYMSLQKIGVQERRKYNVGANAGFRYQF